MNLVTKYSLNERWLSGWIAILLLAANVASVAQSPIYNTSFSVKSGEFVAFPQQYSSFQDSCRDIRVYGNTLSARCRTERGGYVATSIEIRGITNINGVLEYLREGRGRSTYQQTCNNIRISGATLSARCLREDNSYNNTSIYLRGIVNNDGRLEYNRGDGGNNGDNSPPSNNPASFQDSCRNIRVNMTTLTAQCRDENGRWQASSIEIRGIRNVNGNLEYLREGRRRSTYQDSCTEIRINGSNLRARCQRENGSYKPTSIELIGIVNDNGRLRYSSN
ncbi:MAG TPA: CVNH domain-containing protein [Pyrinomonadaceae bacterium]|jgi:hypothetical protein